MRSRLYLVFYLILLNCLFSCKTTRTLTSSAASPSKHKQSISSVNSVSDYVTQYKDLAISEMRRTGIPASITLAQGIIESDCGRSTIAREANNHFGIKCHDDWTGPTIRHDDNKRNECFRKYKRAEDSYYDHSDFLKGTNRYNFLFNINPADYKAWAYGLKKAGYATDPAYPGMLIRTIEENNLSAFDHGDISDRRYLSNDTVRETVHSSIITPQTNNFSTNAGYPKKIGQAPAKNVSVMARVPRVMENNRIQYIIVKDGDTREKIENEFQLLRWELAKYNEIKNDFELIPGQILYLQPKRDKAEAGKDFYNVKEGDTMYNISQMYGIKLKKLYEMNRMDEGTEPEAGRKIYLRNIKPAG